MPTPEADTSARLPDYAQLGWTYSAPARLLSLLLALAMSGVLLLVPFVLADDAAAVDHGLLMLSMWGISAGFVHGVGFVPLARLWRWLLGPWVAWVVMLGSASRFWLG